MGQGYSGHGAAGLPQVRAPSPGLPMRERDPRHKEADMSTMTTTEQAQLPTADGVDGRGERAEAEAGQE